MEKIVSGGLTSDYLAINEHINKKVVLRIGRYTEGFKNRLQHVTKIHASLNHPHIHDVYDFFTHENYLCTVLQYIEGKTLLRFLEESAPLKWTVAFGIARQISDALAYIHQKQIVHGSIKPNNIVMGNDQVYISKFSSAKLLPQDETLPQDSFLGTVKYSAPEALRGFAHLVPQSDIWSLGTVLYEMLTGNPPFSAKLDEKSQNVVLYSREEHAEIAHQISEAFEVNEYRITELHFPKNTPAEIEQLLRWMLEKSLAKRCPSCEELSARITSLLNLANAFVALPFHQDFQDVRNTIKKVCKRVGVECYIVDETWETGDIVSRIRDNIRRSDFVIADMSPVATEFLREDQKVANTNVTYEVGLAHAYEKNVILMTQDLNTLAFDISKETAITYKKDNLQELEEQLAKFIGVLLRKLRK